MADSEEIRNYLRKHYQEETLKEIGDKFGLTKGGVLYHAKKMGIWDKSKSQPVVAKRMADFFKEWTPEMAFVLGYLYADGHYSVNKKDDGYTYHSIFFRSIDKDIIEDIYDIMGCENQKIRESVTKWNGKKTGNTTYTLQIGSIHFKNILPKLGIKSGSRKTYEESNVKIKDGYGRYFWHGFFDGDGSITKKTYKHDGKAWERDKRYEAIFCFTSSDMREKASNWLSKNNISYSYGVGRKSENSQILFLYVSSKAGMVKLRKLFYKDFDYGMDRKRRRFYSF